jgi:serine/threonine protein kinase
MSNEETNEVKIEKIEDKNLEKEQEVKEDIKSIEVEENDDDNYDEINVFNESEIKDKTLFEISKKIGGGAEGSVYLAERKANKKKYAIKSVTVHTEDELKRLTKDVSFFPNQIRLSF